MPQDVHFANVEFELECHLSLTPLLNEIGHMICIHHHDRRENGNDFASFDVEGSGLDWDVDTTISKFCDLVEGLSPEANDIWLGCAKRELDIGFESGDSARVYEGRIENKTLARVAKIGATIEITIYPVDLAGS
jgi:hypothetical protein